MGQHVLHRLSTDTSFPSFNAASWLAAGVMTRFGEDTSGDWAKLKSVWRSLLVERGAIIRQRVDGAVWKLVVHSCQWGLIVLDLEAEER